VSDVAQASEDELGYQAMLLNEMKRRSGKETNFWPDWHYLC